MLRTNPSLLQFMEKLYNSQTQPHIALKQFAAGRHLVQQGGTATKVYIIKEGITKCYITEDNGKDFIIEFLSAGESIGDIEAIKHIKYLCNIRAITQVSAWALDMAHFRHLMEKDKELNQLLMQELAERLINTSIRTSSQQSYTVEHGLKKLLDFQHRQGFIFAKEDLAAYLGITTRSLNRALRNLGNGIAD